MAEKIYLNVTFLGSEVYDDTDHYNTIMALDNRYGEITCSNERVFVCPCEVELENLVYTGDAVFVYRDGELFLINTDLVNPDTDVEIMEVQGMGTETIKCSLEKTAEKELLGRIRDMEARRTYSCADRFTQELCSWIANDPGLALEIDSEMQQLNLDIKREDNALKLGSDFRIAVANALTNTEGEDNSNAYVFDLALSYLDECYMQEVLDVTKSILEGGTSKCQQNI